ncbi:hypothetical protein CHS0354_023939 [Potamilus streckersoni]|uniref:RNA-binding S4 domain-containing protein n=1 Tax=Potamilus streckersoni TaxID=2493646 RepID=A0AAE0RZJ3_9BIVA|nr:hypothetical protein CHS0354_023939 [Potamilus streckersoni]
MNNNLQIRTTSTQPKPETREIRVERDKRPERIDSYLTRQIEYATRTKVQTAIEEGRVLVNRKDVKPSYKIKPNDHILITFTHPPAPELLPENIAIDIIHEDDAILVINKPPGMVVHPAYGNWTGTLANAALYHAKRLSQNITAEFSQIPEKCSSLRPGIIHRLDKDTSGVIVITKTDEAAHFISKQFAARTTKKTYFAITWGKFKNQHGKIETNIGRSNKNRKVMSCYDVNSNDGKYALTEYHVHDSNRGFSWVELILHTGRTHQIRVHLQYMGHPIIGDKVYGKASLNIPTIETKRTSNFGKYVENLLELIPRQALHARELRFIHPLTRAEHGNAPKSFGNAPKSFGNAPKSFGNAPKSFGNAPKSFGNAPKSFGNAPKSFGNAPKSFGNAPKSFGNAPKSFGNAPKSFRQMLKSFQQMLKSFQQMLKSFQQMLKSFQQMLKSFQQMLKSFQQMLKSFQQMLKPFQQMLKPFQQMLKSFQQMLKPFQQMLKPFQQMLKSFQQMLKPFRH